MGSSSDGGLGGLLQRLLGNVLQVAVNLIRALISGFVSAPARGIAQARATPTVRRAQVDELLPLRHAVLRAGKPISSAHFEGDHAPDSKHWVLTRLDQVIGVVSVLRADRPHADTPERWQLRGMAILPELQGQGLGRGLLEAVHTDIDAPLWCNARARAISFYERAGWEAVGAPFDIPDIGPHQQMRWSP